MLLQHGKPDFHIIAEITRELCKEELEASEVNEHTEDVDNSVIETPEEPLRVHKNITVRMPAIYNPLQVDKAIKQERSAEISKSKILVLTFYF